MTIRSDSSKEVRRKACGSRKFVSVVLPVYNGDEFLAGAIRNILNQNYEPLEIIVVDDGSTDRTAGIAAGFANRIHYCRHPNRGPAAARNRGISLARGELITFLDVDDLWPADKLETQASYLAGHPSVEIVQGLIQRMILEDSSSGEPPGFTLSARPYQFINLGSGMYRRAVFEKVGLFDESLRTDNSDTDWFFRAWERNVSKVVLKEVALYYRLHRNNMVHRQRPARVEMVKLFKRHLDRRRAGGAPETELPHLGEYIGIPPPL